MQRAHVQGRAELRAGEVCRKHAHVGHGSAQMLAAGQLRLFSKTWGAPGQLCWRDCMREVPIRLGQQLLLCWRCLLRCIWRIRLCSCHLGSAAFVWAWSSFCSSCSLWLLLLGPVCAGKRRRAGCSRAGALITLLRVQTRLRLRSW